MTLRTVHEDDYDAIFAVFAEFSDWEDRGGAPPSPMTRAAFLDWYPRMLRDEKAGAEFAIVVDDQVVGRCSLFAINTYAQHAEYGIALRPDQTGRGYGTDAGRALLEFGFERRNLNRIHLQAVATNAPALASYRKLGFVEEGRQREHAWVRGRFVDMVSMGLLRSEWRRDRPAGRTP